MKYRIAALALGAALCACVPQSQYYWGSYSDALYDYYNDPAKSDRYRASLQEVIETGGPDGRIPPGVFAEIGFLELKDGRPERAREFFRREKAAWPESTVFMDRVIDAIDNPGSRSPTDINAAVGEPADAKPNLGS